MGNCYRDQMYPKTSEKSHEMLKKKDNPIQEYVDQQGMHDFVVFDSTRAMEIFLHSKQYQVLEFSFETADPYWASPDFRFEDKFIKKNNDQKE